MKRIDLTLSDDRRRAVGTLMIAVALVGFVLSAIGTVVVWQLLGRLDTASEASIDVTIDTLDTLDDSIVLADGLIAAVEGTLDTAVSTLDTVAMSFSEADGVIDEIGDLTAAVGPALEEATGTLRQLEDVGTSIDRLLESVDDLPLVPNYDPDSTLGESIGAIADELGPLPEEFEQTSAELDDFDASIADLQTEVAQLKLDVEAVAGELEASDELVRQYRQNIRDARTVAVDTRDGLGTDVLFTRLVLVVGGVNLAISQIVPLWLGSRLRGRREETGLRENG